MKTTQQDLDRLFRAAAAAPEDDLAAMPYGFDTRVLALSAGAGEDDASMLPLFRAGLAFACVLLVVTTALSLRGLQESAQDEIAASNAIVRLASIP